jgi:hypothetical protein
MSKYDPLSARLAGHAEPEWRASFAEIEEVLGFPLPKTALTNRAWWHNTGAQPHQRSWTGSGWEVAEVDHAQGRATFRKAAAAAPPAVAEAEPAPLPSVADEPAILKRLEATPKWSLALVTGGLVLAASLGVFAIRGAMRKK